MLTKAVLYRPSSTATLGVIMELEITFKAPVKAEQDRWSQDGNIITDPDKLSLVEEALREFRILVIEHRYYRGARAPDRIVIDDYDNFIDYLIENAVAGDSIHVFDITSALEDDNQLVNGKCPDEKGEVPKGGAY